MRCTSFCTAEAYQGDLLVAHLQRQGYTPRLFDGVIHIQRTHGDNASDIFFFPYGCIIIWGCDAREEREVLALVQEAEVNPLPHFVEDYSTFLLGDTTEIREESDEIVLEADDVLIKLSISHGLSQSVKLGTFEESIGKTIEKTRHLPKELAGKGKISLSRKKLAQQLGSLFAERNSINLHTDILDVPEFFWRRPQYEPYYLMAAAYMDIQMRLDILNKRLDVIHELYEILSNELNHIHSSRLEWIIIILIVIEVVLVLLKDFFHVL
jgi:uncharacterized Rmd1/YagE family protein